MVGTGIVYSPDFTRHVTPLGHPESPQRVLAIAEALKKVPFPLAWLEPRAASIDEIALAHTKSYIELVIKEVGLVNGIAMLSTGDVVICSESFEIASLAVGAALVAVDAVMQGKVKNCFCAVRPPGHHATASCGMGFCLFNNVACAARYLQKKYGLQKVLIVDWDLHHGNGTEAIFYRDPSVFYFSTHQKGIYPGTGNEGEGNCPIMPGKGSKEAIFEAFETVLAPKIEALQPEFVFISAGFDAHKDDPLGALYLDDKDFFDLTCLVQKFSKKWAHGKIVSVLEGGYNLDALRSCSVQHVTALACGGNT